MKCTVPMKTWATTKRWNILSKKTLKSLYASPQYAEIMEPNLSSCTWNESCWLCHRVNQCGWAAWRRNHNFFCKDDSSKNKSSGNRNNFPIICWKFICSNESALYIDLFLINSKCWISQWYYWLLISITFFFVAALLWKLSLVVNFPRSFVI